MVRIADFVQCLDERVLAICFQRKVKVNCGPFRCITVADPARRYILPSMFCDHIVPSGYMGYCKAYVSRDECVKEDREPKHDRRKYESRVLSGEARHWGVFAHNGAIFIRCGMEFDQRGKLA